MFTASDIKHMSASDRLEAMEVIWISLSKSREKIPSSAWHEEVLSHRLAKVENGQGNFLTLTQLKERFGIPHL